MAPPKSSMRHYFVCPRSALTSIDDPTTICASLEILMGPRGEIRKDLTILMVLRAEKAEKKSNHMSGRVPCAFDSDVMMNTQTEPT